MKYYILFFLQAVAALITKGTADYVGSLHQDYNCPRCLAADFQFCATDKTYARHSSLTTTDKCLSKTATCPSRPGIKVSNSVELAILSCPTLSTICGAESGTTPHQMWTTFESTADSAITAKALLDMPQYSTCFFGFKAKCGAPYLRGTGFFGQNDGLLALLHYTNDDRFTGFAEDSSGAATEFPPIDSSIHVLDTTCSTAAQCSANNQQGSKLVFRKNSTAIVQSEDILISYLQYRNKAVEYYKEFLVEYRAYAESWPKFFDYLLSIATLGAYQKARDPVEGVTPPSSYDGLIWKNLTSLGGWGDLSIQTMDGNTDKYFEFGIFGSSSTAEPTEEVSNAVDLNMAECVDRYAVVVMYNPGTTVVTEHHSSITGKSGVFATNSSLYQSPANVSEELKGLLLKCSFLLLAGICLL